ncbi:MAG: c-type cytochrome domain-containing protein [Planctomycetota bacterium]
MSFWSRLSVTILLAACVTGAEDATATATAAAQAESLWKDKVQPLLAERCYECHGEKKAKHDLRLHTKEGILKGGKELGAAVIPGKPDLSPLLKLVKLPADEQGAMPEKGSRLTKEQLGWISDWIAGGAPMPENAKKSIEAAKPAEGEPKKK